MAAPESLPAASTLDRAVLAAFLAVVLAFCAFDVYNYDIPIYLRKGAWCLEHGEIPTPDRFLFADFKDSIRGKEKWLFQIVVTLAYRALGWLGLVLLRMAVVLPAFFLAFLLGRGAGRRGAVTAGLLGLLALVTAHERLCVRPELPSLLFAAIDLFLLTRDRWARDRWVWAVVGVQVLWVNMHSSHPIGLGLAGFACAGALLRVLLARRSLPWAEPDPAAEWKYAKRTAAVLGAVILATFVSPAPIQNAWYPFNLASYLYQKAPWFSEAIYEILPPFHAPELFPTYALAAYRILLAVTCLSFVVNWRRVDPFHLIAHTAFLVYSLSMRRNLSYFAMICGPIAAWNFAAVPALHGLRPRRVAAAVFFAAALWLAPAALSNHLYQSDRDTRRTGLGLSGLAYPLAADRFLAERDLRGHVITNWDAGSWLAFTSFPDRIPYIHTEGEYNLELFDAYRKTMSGRIDYHDVVARYHVVAFLLRHTAGDVRPLLARLSRDPEWVLVFADATAAVYVKDVPERAALIAACRVTLPAEDEVRRAEPRLAGEPAAPSGSRNGWLDALADRGAAFDRAREAFNLGTFYGVLGRVDLEAAQYLKAIDACPGMPEAHDSLGACFAHAGLAGAAERELRAALALKEDFPNAHRNLGLLRLAHSHGPEDLQEALLHLERAVRLNPKDVSSRLDLARGEIGAGDLEAAARSLEEAAAADPDDPRADATLFKLYAEGLHDPQRADAVRRRIEARKK